MSTEVLGVLFFLGNVRLSPMSRGFQTGDPEISSKMFKLFDIFQHLVVEVDN